MRLLVLIALLLPLACLLPAVEFAAGLADAARSAWSEADGLPQNTVYAVCRGRDGFLWIGTDSGLVRFDGLSFQGVSGAASHGTLTGKPVTALAETSDGALWIATYGEGLVRLHAGGFRRFRRGEGLPSDAVWCLAAWNGTLWAGTVGGGLARVQDGEVRTVSRRQGLPGATVLALAVSGDGALWVGTDRGLARGRDGSFTAVAIPGAGAAPPVRALHVDQAKDLWVGTAVGLFRLRGGSWRRYDRRHGLPGPFVRVLAGDGDGRLWVGGDDGLALLLRDGRFRAWTRDDGLTDNTIMAVRGDDQGSIWLGTAAGGLMRLRRGAVRAWGDRQGLPDRQLLAVCQDDAGSVWLGSYGAGVVRLRDGVCERPVGLGPLATAAAYALLPVGGDLWIGSQAGLWRLGTAGLRPVPGLESLAVTSLLADSEGRLLAGTSGRGPFRVTGDAAVPLAAPPGLDRAAVPALARGRDGALWVATFGDGLYRLSDGAWRRFGSGDGLPGSSVFALLLARDGTLWCGGEGGVARLRGDRFRAYGRAEGLPAGTVYSLVEAGGRLWMGSHRGVWSVALAAFDRCDRGQPGALQPLRLDERDGLPSAVCSGGFQPAAWRDLDGTIWFTTMRGAAAVDPQRALTGPPPPAVVIEGLWADDRRVSPAGEAVLPGGRRRVEIRFRAPDLVAGRNLRLRYRLQGRDEEWREAGRRRSANYEGLPPGRYRFLLACARGGLLSTATLAFRVRPRFRQTWPFRLGAALAAGIVLLLARRTIRRRRRNARYRLSTLTSPQARLLEIQLLKLMADGKPYLDPDLSLPGLAAMLDVPAKHLSQVINDRIGLHFSDFVNRQRVAEARRLLADPRHRDDKLLAIAFACGFNSKSVFNSAFRKFTGLSPSEFRASTRT